MPKRHKTMTDKSSSVWDVPAGQLPDRAREVWPERALPEAPKQENRDSNTSAPRAKRPAKKVNNG
jgi:hypothetical protein